MSIENELDRANAEIARLRDLLEQRGAELGTERSLVSALRIQFANLESNARRLDELYQATAAQLAEVRLALKAPNPCNFVEWATRAKHLAGPMAGELSSSLGELSETVG